MPCAHTNPLPSTPLRYSAWPPSPRPSAPWLRPAASSDATPAPPVNNQTIDPVAFFTGHAEGRASLHELLSAARPLQVHSDGRSDGKGGVILVQRIEQEGRPERTRSWHLVPAGPGRFTGTLTDANGPVEAIVDGPHLNIHYPMKGGLEVAQTLTLSPDATSLVNRMSVTKMGLRVAHLEAFIRKQS